MTLFIDKKFINLMSGQLERFSWKKDNLANCRCPICGDSSKNKVKARGFFFEKKGEFFFKCHNCSVGLNLYNFMSKVAPNLCKEYCLEKFKEKQPTQEREKPKMLFSKKPKKKYTIELPTVAELPPNHACRQFVELRQIPKKMWQHLYYAEDFAEWARRINRESAEGLASEPRLVIPILDRKGHLVGAQGRIIKVSTDRAARKSVRYITIKPDDQEHKSWYGLDRMDQTGTVYVVEGPLDSLFIPNCLATVGMSDVFNPPKEIRNRSVIYVMDNEPRNVQVVQTMEKLVQQHKRVCVWPEHIKCKDINDMIMGGLDAQEIINIVNDNSASGLEAQIRINKWKKM
jgi:hypothetical protein